MSQTLKDSVREAIHAAALKVFAERAYASATMAGIARVAGVSTGNLYIYFANKDDLFRAVVPDAFATEATARMLRKVESLRGIRDVRTLDASSPFHVLGADLLQFWIANRERMIILLLRAHGTVHERFAEQTVEHLVRVAIAYLASVRPGARVTEVGRFALDQIYRHHVNAMASVLVAFDDEKKIREAAARLTAYHLAGLQHAFAVGARDGARRRAKTPAKTTTKVRPR